MTAAIVSLLFVVNKEGIKTIYNINMKLEYLEKIALEEDVKWVICCKGEKIMVGIELNGIKRHLII